MQDYYMPMLRCHLCDTTYQFVCKHAQSGSDRDEIKLAYTIKEKVKITKPKYYWLKHFLIWTYIGISLGWIMTDIHKAFT